MRRILIMFLLLSHSILGEGFFEQHSGFLPGTLVNTIEGYKAIEDIEPGDCIYSCTDTDYFYATVINIEKKPITSFFKIRCKNGLEIGVPSLQQFDVIQRGWNGGGYLRPGDRLRCFNKAITVTDIEEIPATVDIYVLELEGDGYFFVSKHNIKTYTDVGESIRAIKKYGKWIGGGAMSFGTFIGSQLLYKAIWGSNNDSSRLNRNDNLPRTDADDNS